MTKLRLGVDTGGTFTDFVLVDGDQLCIHKQLSTPAAPEQAILEGVKALGLKAGEFDLVHGSTVATNAALEGKGVKTAYVTNTGFKDVLTLGRQARRELYNLQLAPETPPVPEALCFEVNCRLSASGAEINALTQADCDALIAELQAQQPQAVAINLLFSFLDNKHELQLAATIREAIPDVFVCCSSQILPEYREYERGMATWLNAWLGPLVDGYIRRLQQGVAPSPVAVMQSTGGTLAANKASKRAVNLLLSGPAGGLMAAKTVAEVCGEKRVLTFDMGGTSTDVALVSGNPSLTTESSIGHFPVAVPTVDMHTIGAGGGSLAWIDDGGLLQVGPQSAGASPGPACYGKGGQQPTVTDANLVLGRLRASAFLGGGMALDVSAARAAVARVAEPLGLSVEEAALGIVQIANEHMAQALRVISVQQGEDPRQDALMAFGGAAGLHMCALADALEMPRAIAPIFGGVLSALGMLVAPKSREVSRSVRKPLRDASSCEIEELIDQLSFAPADELRAEGVSMSELQRLISLDLRYVGQSHCLNIPLNGTANIEALEAAFHAAHEQRYGHALEMPVEWVNLRVSCRADNAGDANVLPTWSVTSEAMPFAHEPLVGYERPVPIYKRDELAVNQTIQGPALIVEQVSTLLVEQGWAATVDTVGNMLLKRV
ncbi:MAG: hydantoinase/oxoprolinase family protein [Gammaproteobacteria bacterium]|nr:hydantoinase/oxoprolinase family protein [Gammaproteobacteria bacterium]